MRKGTILRTLEGRSDPWKGKSSDKEAEHRT